MILNRLARAFAQQHWGTVVLEILVVVVGIFLGLQVDDWNENRKFRQLESLYLDKLRSDLATMRQDLDEKFVDADATRRRMVAALAALEDCTLTDRARADLEFALVRYQVQNPINYLSATYDEMVVTGALARISDDSLKQQIASTFSQLVDLNATQRAMRVSMPVVDRIVWNAVSFSADRDTGEPRVSFDMPRLCDDTEFRNAMVEMIDLQWDTQSGARRGREAVGALLETLDEGLGDH